MAIKFRWSAIRRRAPTLVVLGALAACGSGSPPATNAPHPGPAAGRYVFTNGDFENDAIGTMPPSGWTLLNYLNPNGVSGTASAPPSSFSALNLSGIGTGVNDTYVVGGATLSQADPDLGTGQSFRFPLYGQRSARLNYKDATTDGKNKNANVLRQSMTVGLADVDPTDGQIHVRFAIAPVLENPAHAFNQQPYFYVELLDLTRGTSLYNGFNTAGQTGVPWHTTTSVATGNATQWLDWALVDIAPGPAALSIGDEVQLTVVASGCALGGHFGRVYLDGMGATVPGPYVTATAPQSVNASATLTYTLTYANGGSTAAIGAHVDQVTPPNTTFASVAGVTGCTTPAVGSAGTISCPIGTLNPGTSGSFTITVTVASTATGNIVNGNYSIGSVNQPTLLGAKVTTKVNSSSTSYADIVVVKTASVTATPPGTAFTSGANNPLYTITVTNNSATDQIRSSLNRSITVTDAIPSQLTGVTWACTVTNAGSGVTTAGGATKCRDQGGSSSFNGTGNSISLSPRLGYNGGQITINVYGTVSASASGPMINTASTSVPSGTTDPNLANNTSTVSVFVGTPRTLTLSKAGGNANGTVTSAPSGISCGTSCGSTSGTFADGSQVVLSASPVPGASFSGWSGAGAPAACTASPAPLRCTLTISGNMTVTATFAPPPAVGPPAAVYVYSGNNQLTSTGTGFANPIAALVSDANGLPVSGTTVTFTAVPSGGGASTSAASGTATTNASGIATLAVSANSTAGTYTVNATVSGVTSPATFTLTNVGPAASITYLNGGSTTDPQSTPINTQYAAPLLAVVRDSAGNPVPGVTVTYAAVPASGASCTVSNGTTSAATVTTTTDASGIASVTATANGTVGAFTVTASVSGVATPATFHLQNVSSGPSAVYVVSGSPQTTPTSAAFTNPLVAVVSDSGGNSLPGITVNFTAQTAANGATSTLSAGSAVTNSSGLASVTATANATGGVYTVTASVSGVATTATFTLTNDGGQSIQVSAGSPQSATVGTAFGAQLQALVLDGTGAAVNGAVVTFQAPASGASATLSGGSPCAPAAAGCQTATTNASGIARVTATANSISGEYMVSATTPNAPTAAMFDLTNQCTADSQCSGITPICDTTAHSCVACATNVQCSNKSASQPYCDASGACFACISDSQCNGTTPICGQATNSCSACVTDAQCSNKDPANPYCLGTGSCFAGYAVTASAGANGSVSPSGTQTVAPGGTLSITITPAVHYHVADVLVDGASVGAVTSYSFTSVSGNHTLSASFAIDQFTVTGTSGGNGTVACQTPVDYGSSSTCTISPASGYQLSTLTDNSVDVASQVISGSYIVPNVTSAHTVAAAFSKLQGNTCTTDGECGTGHCADGYCCDTACSGQCQACDVSGDQGVCTAVAGAPHGARAACTTDGSACGGTCNGTDGSACAYPGASTQCRAPSCSGGVETIAASCAGTGSCPALATQSCGAYACGATACKTTCAADGDCSSGNYCNGSNQCVAKKTQGTSCAADHECSTGACVDGVCCNSSCAGQCQACDLTGNVGTCTTVTSGAPHGARAPCNSDGSACGGTCNGSSAASCGYPGGGTQCRAPSCNNGVETVAASCGGTGSCPAMTTQSCGAYVCDATACKTTCSADSDCASGNYCDATNACVPKKAQGAVCGGDHECGAGPCVDGYCCDRACGGQCEACDVAGSEGTCSPASGAPHGSRASCASDGTVCGGSCDGTHTASCTFPGSSISCRAPSCTGTTATLAASCDGSGSCPPPQTQDCTPFSCGPAACAGNCSADSDCPAGNWCSAGVCVPLLSQGQSCGGANQCGSGHCVDGVCCDTGCTGQCEACAETGTVGTCTAVVGVPRVARPPCASDGSVCGGACDGTHPAACAYPGSGTSCRDPSCSGGVAVLAAGCDGAGACPPEQDVNCAPYTCGPTACSGNCTVDSDCASGSYCAAGLCHSQGGLGVACTGANQCASGQCVDGVCCNSSCTGQCEACDVPASAGTCTNVAGAPHGARQACASDGSGCGGACDGSSAAACAYPTGSCRVASCSAGVATLAASCDGAGNCPAAQTQGCNPYTCGASACLGNCVGDADCVSGDFCSAGVCAPLRTNGSNCASANQCASGQCVDGVCCNSSCGGQCQACDVPGQVGTCTAVAGAPHGARQACSSDGTRCGGACDGTDPGQCAYPGSAVQCRAQACANGVITEAASCNGAGRCPAAVQDSCGGAACDGNACASGACSSDAQCTASSSCVAGVCQPKGTPGVWVVAGSGGCASGGAGDACPLLALAFLGAWRALRRRRAMVAALVVLSPLALRAQTVPVQPQFNADRFNPGAGSADILSVGSAAVPGHLDVHVSLFSSYARDPLRLIAVSDSTQQYQLLHGQMLMHLGASVGLFDRFELGLTLPMLVAQSASQNDLLGPVVAPGEGIGDLRLVPKALLWSSPLVSVAMATPLTLPTGRGDAFLSHGSATFAPEVRVESDALPVRLAASAGVALRGARDFANLNVGNALTYGVGGELPFSFWQQSFSAMATLAGEAELQKSGSVERPMELLAALRWFLPRHFHITVGGGPGLTDGYGTPRYRVFAGIGFDPGVALRRAPARPPLLVQEPPPELPSLRPIEVKPDSTPPVHIAQVLAPDEGLTRTVRDGHVVFLAQVQFAHDAATILPASLPLLRHVADVLRDTPGIHKVEIQGHTDGRGKPAYNRQLSRRRAQSVLRYLVKTGIDSSRLTAIGFGPDHPRVPNDTPAHRAQNRRVEFVVLDGPLASSEMP